ncbi:hypothetical protein I547_1761 [Mycobacterium kansasii 824]|nr:hypothetical protein I547_1761 [Mycobacterium kansasii 824]KEP44157.1 hypothetical protein MKSMC1_07060 [Mycobacterium kansasii]
MRKRNARAKIRAGIRRSVTFATEAKCGRYFTKVNWQTSV